MRQLAVLILATLGCMAFSVYVIVNWVERQILTTDNWVALVSPLPKEPVVSTALGSYISMQVFAAAPVEQRIAEALPPRAVFLAGPLTDQLNTLTTRAAQRLVASDGFQTIWTGANRIAMDRLLERARAPEGATPGDRLKAGAAELGAKANQKFDVDFSEALPRLREALGSAGVAVPDLQPAADKKLAVSADLQSRPERLREFVRTTDNLAAILPLFVTACLVGMFALAHRRRQAGFAVMIIIVLLMLSELIAIKWLRQEVLAQVRNAEYLSAIGYLYDTAVVWLKEMVYAVLAAMAVLYGLLLLGGPGKWAVTARQLVRLDKLGSSRLMAGWRDVRAWVATRQYYLWLGVVLVVLAGVAMFASVDTVVAINTLLVIVSLVGVIHIIATPGRKEVAAKTG